VAELERRAVELGELAGELGQAAHDSVGDDSPAKARTNPTFEQAILMDITRRL
jgi:hypothetical protein